MASGDKKTKRADGAKMGLDKGCGAKSAVSWHAAATARDAPALSRMIAAGADLDARGAVGWTAAMTVASKGSVECLRLLVEAGCDVDACASDGATAAMLARGADGASHDCLELLAKRGADLDAQDKGGWSCAMFAADEGDQRALRILIQAGCDVNLRDYTDNSTAAMMAADAGHVECVELLLAAGSDMDGPNDSGLSLVAMAELLNNGVRDAVKREKARRAALAEASSIESGVARGRPSTRLKGI